MQRFVTSLLVLVINASATCRLSADEPNAVDFARDVKPIFAKHCFSCHGPDKQRGDLRLDRKADALRGGESGTPVVAGKADSSLLVRRVIASDDTKMPPKGDRLSAAEVAILKSWIGQGAPWPEDGLDEKPTDWWSFKPIRKPSDAKTIDEFISAKLKEKALTSSPEADRRTLYRRLSFDLLGLPPKPDEVEAFVNDPDPQAYEKLVAKMLKSPHYGERWARHWLDVVHFGETHGYDKDKPRPNAWPYRDYVIRSLNDDKPYGRFIQEQIAGDALFPGTVDGIEALGFLAAGPWDFIGHAELPETKIDGKVARHLDRDDFVANTIGTFMGLTVHCAQCHNHKFDPIRQDDYYRLQAVFAAIDRTDYTFDTDPQVAARRTVLKTQRKKSTDLIAKIRADIPKSKLPELTALEKQTAQRESWFKATLGEEKAASLLSAEADLRKVDAEIAKLAASLRTVFVGAVHTGGGNFVGTGASGGTPRPIHMLSRGDVTKPGKIVSPGAIAAIPGLDGDFHLPAIHKEADRRAALARWLSSTDNPLTWRVMANRVWQYHFGRGLVDTPNDFGKMGQRPTHPELLDFLAADLREHQSIKRLHTMIVTSRTYRQASTSTPANAKLDIDNQFLWRQNRRKLEAEAVRDSILSVAGKLNLAMGGPSFQDFVIERPEHSPHYQYHLHDPDDIASHRRSIYRFTVRSKQQPFMAALDCADPSMAVEKRNQTQTPQQALALLNNRLAVTMVKHLAERVRPLGTDTASRVSVALTFALGRAPTAKERDALSAYADQHGLENACRVILNLNEFVFVD